MNHFSWSQTAKTQWDERAEDWHAASKNNWTKGSRKEIIPFFKEYIPKGTVADMGCGDGYGSLLLSQEGYRVTGIDLSKEMIDRAREYENSFQDNPVFLEGSITKTSFLDQSFDAVIAINSLEWIEFPIVGLNEMKRIVKKGGFGCFAILGPTAMPRINSYERLLGRDVICNTMMPWEFERLALETGWEKAGEKHVYKRGIDARLLTGLSNELKQALSFLTLFMLKKS
jgi:ubiquinone/menaquinone biosynthesis C-methylase UbiE